jgi:uncharacterized protein (TIGR02246 family)
MQRLFLAVSVPLLLITGATLCAQDKTAAGQPANAGIRKLFTQVEDNFNRGDAKGLAACWTRGGDFVGPAGERIEGRDSIEKAFQTFLASRADRRLEIHLLSWRMVGDGVALADIVPEVTPAPATAAGESVSSLVLVKHDDRWLLESVRETVGRVAAQPAHLQELEWMVGDWADESPQHGLSLQSTCAWTVNRAFLIRKFHVETNGGTSHAGTEVIGWDPRTQRIRSWVFDSDGAFGENLWVQDGKRWLIKYSGTLADGSVVSATHVLTQRDANTLTLASKDRTVNGQGQPDISAITIKRQAAASGTVKPAEPQKLPRQALPQHILP